MTISQGDRRFNYIGKFVPDTMFWRRFLTEKFLDQLDACQDDCARRLLLGRSENA